MKRLIVVGVALGLLTSMFAAFAQPPAPAPAKSGYRLASWLVPRRHYYYYRVVRRRHYSYRVVRRPHYRRVVRRHYRVRRHHRARVQIRVRL